MNSINDGNKYMDSYIFYLAIFFISLFFVCIYEHSNAKTWKSGKLLMIFIITLPVIIMQGFRYNVGTDYISYAKTVEGLYNGDIIYYKWYINEPLFIFLSIFSYSILNDSISFFVIDSILMNVIFFKVADYFLERKISISRLYIMYYLLCIPYFLNAERQGLAVVIVWYSIRYVLERRIIGFIICISIAALIHNSAIVGILFYLFNFKFNKVRYVIIFFIIGLPFIFSNLSSYILSKDGIFGKYAKFLLDNHESLFNINYVYWIFILIILFLLFNKYESIYFDKIFIIMLALMQLSSYLLNAYISYGFRISYYFQIGSMMIYSFVMPKINSKTIKYCTDVVFITLFLFYFTYKFYFQGNSEIFPFHFI